MREKARKQVDYSDFRHEPDETMLMLASMKNDNRSWRMIADSLSDDQSSVSPALVRKVTLGLCKSRKVETALGLIDATVEITPCECGEVHTFKTCGKKRRVEKKVDRMAARLTVEEGRQCRTELRSIGYASITDFWRDVANGVFDLRWFE